MCMFSCVVSFGVEFNFIYILGGGGLFVIENVLRKKKIVLVYIWLLEFLVFKFRKLVLVC